MDEEEPWRLSSFPNETAEEGDPTTFNASLDEEIYVVPTGIVVLLSIFYGTISLLAVVGNSLVIWIIVTSRRMQIVTNFFIANLASADIIIGLFAIPFQFQAALLQRWNLPWFLCAFCPFVQVLSVNVSVFTLTAIALDRYRAILHPLAGRPSKCRAKGIIVAIWTASATLATPMAVALRVSILESTVGGRTVLKPFCHNVGVSPEGMRVYYHVVVALQYFTPLTVISAAYIRMGLRLWGTKTPGNAEDQRDAAVLRNKKKVIKMLAVVVGLFAFCWMPLQSYEILKEIYPSINTYKYINIIWFCSHWLAMSNSCYNPFIYAIYNERFQRELRSRFKCMCWSRMGGSPVQHSDVTDLDLSRMPTSDYRKKQRSVRVNKSAKEVKDNSLSSCTARRGGSRASGDAENRSNHHSSDSAQVELFDSNRENDVSLG